MKTISIKELEQLVITTKKPLFVKFYTPWCGVCKTNAPMLAPLLEKYNEQIDMYQIDVDQESLWSEDGNQKYAIKLVPTYQLYNNKKIVFNHNNFLANEILEVEFKKVV